MTRSPISRFRRMDLLIALLLVEGFPVQGFSSASLPAGTCPYFATSCHTSKDLSKSSFQLRSTRNSNEIPKSFENQAASPLGKMHSDIFLDDEDLGGRTGTGSDTTTLSMSSSTADISSSSTSLQHSSVGDLRNEWPLDLAQNAELWDEALRWIPIMIPFFAYIMYDPTAEIFAFFLDTLSQNNWVAVDGGAYQAKIIAPAINGIIVPAISILFANLIGTTITTLRQRQLDIRNCLHIEAGQLRILCSLLDVFPSQGVGQDGNSQENCRRYLAQYNSRLIAESQPALSIESLDYSLDTELNGILAELNRWSSMRPDDARFSGRPSDLILSNTYAACTRLCEERAKRITALRSLFPPLHFGIVSALAVSLCMAFLIETKQDILVFLNAIQLRILWTMLVGTFSALAVVCYDLGNPFRGSYEISKSVNQLYTIRLTLRASLQEPTVTPDVDISNNKRARNTTELSNPRTTHF